MQARDRGAVLANLAAVTAVLGGFGHAAIAMYTLFTLPLAGGERAAVAFPLILCFALAVLTMAWAAWRAGHIGWWARPSSRPWSWHTNCGQTHPPPST